MKKLIFMAFLSLAGLVASCSKDDSPADNDIFVGTYKGKVTFKSDSNTEPKTVDDASITVAKAGDSYVFRFSDGIENLTGVEFKKESETLFNVDFKDGVQYIKVTNSTLNMLYTKDGKTWTVFSAKR